MYLFSVKKNNCRVIILLFNFVLIFTSIAGCGGDGQSASINESNIEDVSNSQSQYLSGLAAATSLANDPCRFPGQDSTSWSKDATPSLSFNPDWMVAIRKSPSKFAQMVGGPTISDSQCVVEMRKYLRRLNSVNADKLSVDGIKLVIATAFAYESAAYGSPTNRPITTSQLLNAKDEGNNNVLVCNHYVSLAIRLFYQVYQASGIGTLPSGIIIHPVGWRNDPLKPNPIGNHTQIFATGVGLNLLLDPTTGSLAYTSLKNHLNGTSLKSDQIVISLSNKKYTIAGRDADNKIRSEMCTIGDCFFPGKVNESWSTPSIEKYKDGVFLMYSYITQYSNDPNESKWKTNAGESDWIDKVAAGPKSTYYYTTSSGALWLVNDFGLVLASTGGINDIVSGPGSSSMFILTSAGALWQQTGSGWVLASTGGVKQIANGENGKFFYELTTDGRLFRKSEASDWTFIRSAVNQIATGMNGQILYVLHNSGLLTMLTSSSEVVVSTVGIDKIESMRYGQYIIYSSGSRLFVHSSAGAAIGPINNKLATFLVAPGRSTVNLFQTNNQVCRGNLNDISGVFMPSTNFIFDPIFLGCQSPSVSNADEYLSIQINGAILKAVRKRDMKDVFGQSASY